MEKTNKHYFTSSLSRLFLCICKLDDDDDDGVVASSDELRLVLWHFGVNVLRVDVSAQADGQDHPEQLSDKNTHH